MGHPTGGPSSAAHKREGRRLSCSTGPRTTSDTLRRKVRPAQDLVRRMVESHGADGLRSAPKQLRPAEVMDALEPLMFSDRGKLGHNVKFDLQTIAKYYGGGIPPGPVPRHDHPAAHPQRGPAPATSSSRWSGHWLEARPQAVPRAGQGRASRTSAWTTPPDTCARTSATDWLMCKYFYPRLKRKGVQAGLRLRDVASTRCVMEIEQAGFPVDRSQPRQGPQRPGAPASRRSSRRCGRRPAGSSRCPTPTPGVGSCSGRASPPIPTDPKTGKVAVEEGAQEPAACGCSARTDEDAASPQITQAVLEYYADRGNQMAEWLLEWSLMEKLRGTFIEGLDPLLTPSATGSCRPSTPASTSTARRPDGSPSAKPNLQNLPRGSTIRDLFVADTGYVLIVADYDQIELRCLAYEAQEPAMIEIFHEGRDIHREAAAAAMRIDAADRSPPDQRQVGKTLNFATVYGAGPGKHRMPWPAPPMQEGQQFLDRYYDQFPGLKPWKSRVLREARQRGDRANVAQPPNVVIPPFGRLRRLPDLFEVATRTEWKKWTAERQAINAVIQGFASYITKMAMMELHVALARRTGPHGGPGA